MTTNQTAIVIRECIREAAKRNGCKPSSVHMPRVIDLIDIRARDQAIRAAYDQGIDKHTLSDAFGRTIQTILTALRRTPAPGECPRCGCTDAAECASRCGTAPAERETADLDAASLV